MTEQNHFQISSSCYVWMRLKAYLLYRGIAEERILEIERSAACVVEDELRYTVSATDQLLADAYHCTGDALIGLKSGLRFQSLKFGLYHSLLGQPEVMHRSVELAIRYLPLETQAIRLATLKKKQHCELVIIPVTETLSRLQLENLTAQIFSRLLKASPKWIRLQLGYAVNNVKHYQEVLNCEVEADKEYTAILFDKQVLTRDLGWKDQAVFATLERLAKKRLSQLFHYTSTVDEVKFLTRQQVLYGSAGIGAIAGVMGVSERSLQKRLLAEGSNYREILGQVKGELALELLHNTRMSAAQIAEQLGFEEMSSFYRFFKRATGRSVAQLRSANLADACS